MFCVDEKTAIQALDRLDPVLPLSPGRIERHGFEYYRHGTRSLYAAFNTQTGEVLDKTAARHTSAEFVAFLADIVAHHPAARRSMSSATTSRRTRPKGARTFWPGIPMCICIYTPTYSSWLNQVELWFSKRERDMIARRVFTG